MVEISFVGLYKLICEAAEQLEAADGCCCSVGWTAAVCLVQCS